MSQSHIESYKRLISAGEANVSVSSFYISCPSLLLHLCSILMSFLVHLMTGIHIGFRSAMLPPGLGSGFIVPL